MRNAVIENGVVVNIIRGQVAGLALVPDDGTAQIGSTWDGHAFHSNIPQVLTPRQFRQALNHFGYRAAVDAAIASADQDTKDWYERASCFERTHPVVLSMAQALGYTPTQIDAVWTYGAAR